MRGTPSRYEGGRDEGARVVPEEDTGAGAGAGADTDSGAAWAFFFARGLAGVVGRGFRLFCAFLAGALLARFFGGALLALFFVAFLAGALLARFFVAFFAGALLARFFVAFFVAIASPESLTISETLSGASSARVESVVHDVHELDLLRTSWGLGCLRNDAHFLIAHGFED